MSNDDASMRSTGIPRRCESAGKSANSFVASGEVVALLRDAAAVSNRHFGSGFDIDKLDLSKSSALRPSANQARSARAKYETERDVYARAPLEFHVIMSTVKDLAAPLERQDLLDAPAVIWNRRSSH